MRRSKVMGFSIPPELHARFENILKTKHQTRSEFFREILAAYFNSPTRGEKPQFELKESDVAQALKTYWDLRSLSPVKVLVVGLGIISQNGKVLIGARQEKDPWIENLSWVFPGGKLESLHFAKEVEKLIKIETGLPVEVKNLVAARIHPDSGFKDIQVVALYFHCTPRGETKEKAGPGLNKLKWIKPSDVFKFFTTSVTDEVTKFLLMIEKGNK